MKLVARLVLSLLLSIVVSASGGDDGSPAPGPTVVENTGRLASLIASSDAVIVGRLESSVSITPASPGAAAAAAHTVRLADILRGPLRAGNVTVIQPSSPSEPEWTPGATYVLFLKQTTGIDQYEVPRGAEGRLLVSADGARVSSLSRAATGPQLDDLGIDGEDLDDFKARIKAAP